MGDQSMLHIIIFDEMDAIMKTRGSTHDSTGVSDSIVNQVRFAFFRIVSFVLLLSASISTRFKSFYCSVCMFSYFVSLPTYIFLQLLSKIDGVDSLNNILIIGMTNRKVKA